MILKKYKVFIIIFTLILIIVLIGTVTYLILNNPFNIFQRKFNFKLPSTVKIINKSYSFYDDSLELKVFFGVDDYQKIVNGMKEYAAKTGMYEVEKENDTLMFTIEVYCTWWNKEQEDSILAYHAFEKGKWGAMTRTVCVLITQDSEGQYFLHIYY